MLNEDFGVLGLSPDASNADLTAAYRRLSKALHPDKTGGCKVREERFKRVAEAYHRIRAARPHDAEADRTRGKPDEREQRRDSTEEASRAAKPEAPPQEKPYSHGADRRDHKEKRHGFEGRPVLLTDTGLGAEMVLAGAVPVVARVVLLLRRRVNQMPALSESLIPLEAACQSWARARMRGTADQEMRCLSEVLSTLRQSLDQVILGDGPRIDEEAATEILLNRSAVTRYVGYLQRAREEMTPGARSLRLSRAAAGVCSEAPDVRAAALAVVARAAARSLGAWESAAVGAAVGELVNRALNSTAQERPTKLSGVLDQAARILDRPDRSTAQRRLAQANVDTVLNWAAAADHMASNDPRSPDVHRPEPPTYPSP